ncbi:MAG: c-type cytochrome biogenesis protein CcmI [Alphaproteobacteria bacterium]|nr:c-type cytochrome biogenesis protein CcmI [Alphaproteobacteria bacterium]
MTLWLILAGMTALALAFVLPPLVRRGSIDTDRLDHEVEIYRDQLKEIDRDRDLGVISEAEAEAARAEVGHRLLAAADDSAKPEKSRHGGIQAIALVVALAVPIGALLTYYSLGTPDAPQQLAALDLQPVDDRDIDLQARIDALLRRVEATPNDGAIWAELGETFVAAGRAADAVQAFETALALDDKDAALLSAHGEALTLAAGGVVTPAARQAFERALDRDPAEPRARYYAGLALYQDGDLRRAAAVWIALERDSPPGAPWLPTLSAQITALADQAGIDTAELGRSQTPGPSAEDVQAAAAMSDEDRQAMIESMVGQLATRLEDNPDDRDGWLRLSRSYEVLDRPADARDAMARAAQLAPEDANILAQLGRLTYDAEGAPDQISPAVADIMERSLALDGDNALALWFIGVVAEQADDLERARELWRRLLDRLEPGTPQYEALKARVEALEAAR